MYSVSRSCSFFVLVVLMLLLLCFARVFFHYYHYVFLFSGGGVAVNESGRLSRLGGSCVVSVIKSLRNKTKIIKENLNLSIFFYLLERAPTHGNLENVKIG